MKLRTLTAVIALALASTAASAAIVDFTIIESRWDNVQGAPLTFQDPAAGTFGDPSRIRWGTPATPGQTDPVLFGSGYEFIARPVPFAETDGDVFALGAFTHQNQPIFAPSITSADLLLRTSFSFDDGFNPVQDFSDVIFSFTFDHDETTNNLSPCPYDETDGLAVSNPPGSPVNANGCADLVTVIAAPGNFEVGGLTLIIEGFAASVDDAEAGIFETAFISGENSRNNALLAASFRSAEIPVPTPLALFGLGLVAMTAVRKFRK